MTKRYPVPYFVKKTLAKKPPHESVSSKNASDAPLTVQEEILAAIKQRSAAKKKKR
ncbi:MAG: hypothetical protein ACHQU0_01505 [Candidatus Paceibacteria bacterium]